MSTQREIATAARAAYDELLGSSVVNEGFPIAWRYLYMAKRGGWTTMLSAVLGLTREARAAADEDVELVRWRARRIVDEDLAANVANDARKRVERARFICRHIDETRCIQRILAAHEADEIATRAREQCVFVPDLCLFCGHVTHVDHPCADTASRCACERATS